MRCWGKNVAENIYLMDDGENPIFHNAMGMIMSSLLSVMSCSSADSGRCSKGPS